MYSGQVRMATVGAALLVCYGSTSSQQVQAPYLFKNEPPKPRISLESRPGALPETILTQGPGKFDFSKAALASAYAEELQRSRIDLLEKKIELLEKRLIELESRRK